MIYVSFLFCINLNLPIILHSKFYLKLRHPMCNCCTFGFSLFNYLQVERMCWCVCVYVIVSLELSHKAMFMRLMFRTCRLQWMVFGSFHWQIVVNKKHDTSRNFGVSSRWDLCICINFRWPIYDHCRNFGIQFMNNWTDYLIDQFSQVHQYIYIDVCVYVQQMQLYFCSARFDFGRPKCISVWTI